jgi:lysozyme family protein
MADAQKAFELLMRAEGRKHHTSKHDRGGETAAGITRRFWPDWPGWPLLDAGITWPDEALEREVYRFYVTEPRQKGMYGGFWSALRCDDIREQRVADRLLLFAVVAGASVAAKTLQRVLSEVTLLAVDGVIGPKTIAAVNSYGTHIVSALERAEVDHYFGIVLRELQRDASSATQWRNLPGWINRSRLA